VDILLCHQKLLDKQVLIRQVDRNREEKSLGKIRKRELLLKRQMMHSRLSQIRFWFFSYYYYYFYGKGLPGR